MSMAVKGKKGGRRRSVAEINVTPLVDVMLVLLIIFMITAPTLKEGFSVEIPQAEATQSVPVEDARMITVTADGYVLRPNADNAEQRYERLSQLVEDLKAYKSAQAAAKKQPVVVIVGDRNAKYERIIQVWNAVRMAGIPQVSFQLEPGGPESAGETTPAAKP
jgi:biopolymer transport protein TolR